MNAPAPDPAVRRRNRGMLLALFALFFGGMLVAGMLRLSGWRPEGNKSKGELLQPYRDLRTHSPILADGTTYDWSESPRTWRIVAMPRDCDGARAADCARLLGDLDKVWRLMGRNADRVHVLWAGATPTGMATEGMRELRLVRADDALRAAMPQDGAGAAGDGVWLVDPNGFVVLRYAPGFDLGGLRSDLSRLLRIN